MVAVIAVCTLPGATALMRTPFAAQEEEIRLTHLAKAYLVETYRLLPTDKLLESMADTRLNTRFSSPILFNKSTISLRPAP